MRKVHQLCFGMLLAVLVGMTTKPVAAQSQNQQALTWLRNGLTEKDLQKKIVAYRKALEFDSLLVEAMYNLGLAYKQQQNDRLAEQWFYKAYHTKSAKSSQEIKLHALLELARTYRRQGKLQACEEALSGAKGLSSDRSIQATILFELGRCIFDQGRYEEALVELRAGEDLSRDNNKGNFRSFIQLVESTIESQRLAETARQALSSGDLNQAQTLVEQLREKYPEHKDVTPLTEMLDSLRGVETNRRALAALYEQAQKEAEAGNLEKAIGSYERLLQQAGDYKDAKTRLEATRQQLAQNQTRAKLEESYVTGTSAMKAGNWALAILSFEKILEMEANYRDVTQRLEEARRALESESTDAIVTRYYTEGVAAMSRNDLGSALAAFERVRKLNPNYRNVADLLRQVDQSLQEKEKSAATAAATLAQTEALYREAMLAREKKDWMQAVVALEKLQMLPSNYPDVTTLLAEARTNLSLADAGATAGRKGNAFLYASGLLIVVVVFPLAGIFALSPALRARMHVLRGNYLIAAQLYEKILQRHPERLKLYPLLANIYLLLGRYDEQALKIYKTIAQLNIATHKRDEINAIVAQNYLTEGRTDSDAIEVLENALKAERQKLNQGKY
ncbi:MAG: tetratricopeptide repeat protein [candidate division KSB1 bacterium]|nr:tetratricopeptide repeat protein [candidate division KSB1 bacterium]MDZ7305041.1 tetratricopeptide repeat protein [candidate division KSB1 bacterium]MDZ7312895.1 tetratricopeptide repeat protein [candidate division KSB1 bacterium]